VHEITLVEQTDTARNELLVDTNLRIVNEEAVMSNATIKDAKRLNRDMVK
jgi:hypothetical protein